MSAELDLLLAALAVRSDKISADVVAAIRAEVPAFADFPLEQQRRDVGASVAGILAGVRDRRPPSGEAIGHARSMGRHRAHSGIPLQDSIAAYHIGYREIWTTLLDLVRREDPVLTGDLAEEVTLLWNWFQRLSAAFANAYAEESQSLLTSRLVARQRLVRSLSDGGSTREQRDDLARVLGFDPDGDFAVVCAALRDDPAIAQLNEVLARSAGTAHSASGPAGTTVIVTQGMTDDEIVSAIQEVFHDAAIAIGISRPGSSGAADSLTDALEGIKHARLTGGVLRYVSDWLLSLVAAGGSRLHPLFVAGVAAATEHAHLAETVDTFLEHRFSTTASARALNLHPNSVKYRLQRWTELTGWDLQTVDGLTRSVVALDLARSQRRG